jgi:hypothetical protein
VRSDHLSPPTRLLSPFSSLSEFKTDVERKDAANTRNTIPNPSSPSLRAASKPMAAARSCSLVKLGRWWWSRAARSTRSPSCATSRSSTRCACASFSSSQPWSLTSARAWSGGAMTTMRRSPARGVALLAVGAPGAALAFHPRRVVSGVSLSGGKAAQWEGVLQEVQRRVREEYDRRAWPCSMPPRGWSNPWSSLRRGCAWHA